MLAGQGSECEMGIPYGVAVDALDDYLRALPAPSSRRGSPRIAGELAPCCPRVAPLGARRPSSDGAERHRTHRALATLIGRLAERRPLVSLLDDLHWADAETVELVAHLIRHPPAGALLALAYRPAQLAPRAPGRRSRAPTATGAARCSSSRRSAPPEAIELLPPGLDAGGAPRSCARAAATRSSSSSSLAPARRGPPRPRPPRRPAVDGGDVPRAVVAAIESELAVARATTSAGC